MVVAFQAASCSLPGLRERPSALIIQEPFPFLGRAEDSRHARLVSIPLERL